MYRLRIPRYLAVLVLLAVAGAACGSDSDNLTVLNKLLVASGQPEVKG